MLLKKLLICGTSANKSFVLMAPLASTSSAVMPMTWLPVGAMPRMNVPVTTISSTAVGFVSVAGAFWARAGLATVTRPTPAIHNED